MAHGHTARSEDAALARDLREGKPEAARELCERFGSRLLAFVGARFAGETELAKDLAIQALTDATRRIRWYDPKKSHFAAWLYGVARGRIRAELRRRSRLKSVPAHALSPIEGLSETPDERDAAEEIASRVDAQRQVALLSGVLTDLEFEVLVLKCIDQLSAREIALAVGRSERAVHSLLHRARTKARKRLADHE